MPHSLKLIFVFHYFIQYKTTFLSTGLTKSSFGFFHKPYRKTRTNLLANAISSINPFFFLVLSFLSQNVTCIYALILLLSVDQWLMFWLITDCCVFRNPLRIAYMGVCVHACSVAKSCLTLCNPRDCSPPGFSVRGIFSSKNTGVDCHDILKSFLIYHFLLNALLFHKGLRGQKNNNTTVCIRITSTQSRLSCMALWKI